MAHTISRIKDYTIPKRTAHQKKLARQRSRKEFKAGLGWLGAFVALAPLTGGATVFAIVPGTILLALKGLECVPVIPEDFQDD